MKETETLHVASLQNMELVTMSRETTADIDNTGTGLLQTDVPLKRMTDELKGVTDLFETATRNPQDNPMKQQMNRLDADRDVAFRRFGRKLAYFELSDIEAEAQAYDVLEPLWKKHRDTPNLNHKNQTGATDNFLNDAAKSPYAEAIVTLTLQPEAEAVRTTNDAVKSLEDQSRGQAANEEVAKAKDLRRELTQSYNFLYTYIYTLANAYPDNAEWSTLLSHMNVIRKRYTELITRRRAATKKDKGAE